MIVGALELPITVTGEAAAVAAVRNVDRVASTAAGRGLRALGDESARALAGIDRLAGGNLSALTRRINLLGEGMRSAGTRAASLAALERTEASVRGALASGNLTLERRITLERTLREVERARTAGAITGSALAGASMAGRLRDRLTGAFGAVGPLVGGLGVTLGGAAVVSGLASTLTAAVAASNRFATSLRVLDSTSRITGVPLSLLQRTSAELQRTLGLTATTTNTMTATAVRFTATAGRAVDTGRFLTAWLDLAASRGLTAAEAMQALETTMAGQDEGLNRLGLRNPSLIYKQWGAGADEASQKGAIVNEVLMVGAAVAGSYAERMGTAQGATERLTAAKENLLVALGQAITGGTGYTGVLGTLTGVVNSMTAAVGANSGAIRTFVRDLASIATAAAGALAFLGRIGATLNVVNAQMQVASAWMRAGLMFGQGGSAENLARAQAQLRAADAAFRNPNGAARPEDPLAERQEIEQLRAEARAGAAGGAGGTGTGTGRTGAGGARGAGASPFPTLLAGGPAGIANTMTGGPLGVRSLLAQPITTPIRVNAKIEAPGFVAEVARFTQTAGRIISGGMARGLSSSIQAAVGAAFDGGGVAGVIKAFGATMLSAVGGIFIDLGETYLMYGGIMQALAALLPNPFTAGAAGLAIGAALIALGSALQGVASGGGKRGGGGGGGSFSGGGGSADQFGRVILAPRAAPVGGQMAPTGRTGTPTTAQPFVFAPTIIGSNDPKAQRAVASLAYKGARRAISGRRG